MIDPSDMRPRRSGIRALFLILLLLAASALLLVGCSSARTSAADRNRPSGNSDSALFASEAFDDEEAVAAVRRLESDPLDTLSASLRRRLFAWLVASPRLQGFASATLPIDELQRSPFPHREELMMQYLFGSAALVVTARTAMPDLVDQQEAGLRSLIAAYRNIVRADPNTHDPFLDNLDGIRRRGELRNYIERRNELKGTR